MFESQRSSERIAIRLKPTEKELLKKIAEEKGITISEYIKSLIKKDLEK